MQRKWIIIFGIVAAAVIVIGFLTRSSNTTVKKENRPAQEVSSGKNSEKGGGKNTDEAAQQFCEHNMAIYLCDECRYEAGIVKVSDTLVDSGNNKGLIRLAQVEKKKLEAVFEVTGEIQMNQNLTARISPAIPGILYSIETDLGQRVKKGEPLFIVHSAELGKAMSDYRKNLTLSQLSEKNYKREKSLFDNKISSELDMTEKQMEYERNHAEFEASEQALLALGLSGKDIESIQKDLASGKKPGLLSVRAPFNGTIIEKNASVGELVGPGKEVIIISDLNTVWVWADVYEQDLLRLLAARKKGAIPVAVKTNAFSEHLFSGVIDYIGSTVNESTRTVKVRAVIKNDDMLLRAGMFCIIKINLGATGEQGLIVPRKALLSDEGQDFVFAKWKDNYFIRRPVKKGLELSDSFEITEGLKPGDTIVVDGAFLLKSDILKEKMGAGCAD
jgi:membrane fusion protein, heavy metal efflux system